MSVLRDEDLLDYARTWRANDVTWLWLMATHHSHFVRGRVAANAHTPQQVYDALADDPHPAVRASLASNPLCAERTVLRIAEAVLRSGERDHHLRAVLAQSERLSDKMHTQLFHEDDWGMCVAYASNLTCPQSILRTLAKLPEVPTGYQGVVKDKYREIRIIARARLGIGAREETEEC